jgi:hypothetical protein
LEETGLLTGFCDGFAGAAAHNIGRDKSNNAADVILIGAK